MLQTRENLLTPDQRKAIEAQEKVKKQKERKLISDMNQCFATGAGMNVLRWIMNECGIFAPPLIIDRQTWDVKEKAMIYNAGRVDLYLRIRKHLDPSITMPVENQGLAKDDPNDIFS